MREWIADGERFGFERREASPGGRRARCTNRPAPLWPLIWAVVTRPVRPMIVTSAVATASRAAEARADLGLECLHRADDLRAAELRDRRLRAVRCARLLRLLACVRAAVGSRRGHRLARRSVRHRRRVRSWLGLSGLSFSLGRGRCRHRLRDAARPRCCLDNARRPRCAAGTGAASRSASPARAPRASALAGLSITIVQGPLYPVLSRARPAGVRASSVGLNDDREHDRADREAGCSADHVPAGVRRGGAKRGRSLFGGGNGALNALLPSCISPSYAL